MFQAGEITDVPLTEHSHRQKQTGIHPSRFTHTLTLPQNPLKHSPAQSIR